MENSRATRLSIRFKLSLVIFGATLAVLTVTSALFIYWQYDLSRQNALQAAHTAVDVLAQDFVRAAVLNSTDITADMVHKLHAFPEIENAVFYRGGEAVLAYAQDDVQRVVPRSVSVPRSEVIDGFASIFTPIRYDGKTYGMAWFRISLAKFDETFARFLHRLAVIVPLLLLFSFLLAIYFQRFFTRPVQRLVDAMNSYVTTGRYALDNREAGSREMARLFSGLTELTTRVKETQQALAEQKAQLLITLESIADGVIATNEQGVVRYMNPVAENITGWREGEALGRPARDIYRIISEDNDEDLTQHIDETLLSGTVYFDLEHIALLTRDNRKLSIQSSIAPMRDEDHKVSGAVIVFQNVTEAREYAHRLRHQASHDPLTDLYNRSEFENRVEQYLHALVEDEHHAMLYLDLDQFKLINDTSGHSAGDALLRQIAQLLRSAVRESDVVARLGGDEFAVFLPHCSMERAADVAEKLRRLISDFSFTWEETLFKIGVSIGVVPVNEPGLTSRELFAAADLACYAAKDLGRNRFHIYQPDDRDLIVRHGEMHWVSVINRALEEDRILLFAQHIVPLHNGTDIEHIEILIRHIDEDGMISYPGAFLPAVERYNLAPELDRWVIGKVLRNTEIVRFLQQHPNVRININLSGLTLGEPSLVDYVQHLLQEAKLPPRALCFEITETAAVSNLAAAARFMRAMKLLGCEFALDDFGSGVSSFAYLSNLPVDYLKIDGSFVRDMHKNSVNHAMVKAINEIGHVMNIRTVAEFVENKAICHLLTELKVDFAQGYHLHIPCPIEEILRDEKTGRVVIPDANDRC